MWPLVVSSRSIRNHPVGIYLSMTFDFGSETAHEKVRLDA